MNAMEERIRSILSEHQEQNCYLIYRLEQGAAQEPAVAGRSVRFLDGENGKTLYAVRSIEEFQALYQPVKDREGLLLSLLADGTLLPQVLALDDSLVGNLFHQLTAPKAASLPVAELSGISFGPVEDRHIPWILASYQHPELCDAFVRRRREAAPALRATAGGRPVGFAMTHCGAELGPVYVESEFRGSGLAGELLRRLLMGMEERNLRAAVYITMENQRSLRWLLRQGFRLCPEPAAWFWRE